MVNFKGGLIQVLPNVYLNTNQIKAIVGNDRTVYNSPFTEGEDTYIQGKTEIYVSDNRDEKLTIQNYDVSKFVKAYEEAETTGKTVDLIA